MSLICDEAHAKTVTFIIRGIGVIVVEVKVVRRNVAGGLGSAAKKCELIVVSAEILSWPGFIKV